LPRTRTKRPRPLSRACTPPTTHTARTLRPREQPTAHRSQQDSSTKEGREATEGRHWWRQRPPTRSPSPTRRRSHSSRPQPPSTPPTSPYPALSTSAHTRTHARSAQNLPRELVGSNGLSRRVCLSHHHQLEHIRSLGQSGRSGEIPEGGRTCLSTCSCSRTPLPREMTERATCPCRPQDRTTADAHPPWGARVRDPAQHEGASSRRGPRQPTCVIAVVDRLRRCGRASDVDCYLLPRSTDRRILTFQRAVSAF
jgi:hypothetical protein